MSITINTIGSNTSTLASPADFGLKTLSDAEISSVNGAGFTDGAAAWGTAIGIGSSVWGGALGTVGVAAAFGAAPIAAAAMLGLAAYGGYTVGTSLYNSWF